MAGLVGADVDQLRQMGVEFEAQAQWLGEACKRIDGSIAGVEWSGGDIENFREQWQARLRVWLLSAADSLMDAGKAAASNAEEQEIASNDVGGGMSATAPHFENPGGGMRALSGSPGSRPSLDEILQEYQVKEVSSEEVLRDWEPVWPVSMFTEPVKYITQHEADLINDLRFEMKTFSDAKDRAFKDGDTRFPPTPDPVDLNGQNDNHNDAFRHAFWNAQLTNHFGEEWAREYTTSHEQIPGNPPVREAMDLYNNEVGRRIAVDNPDASIDELADLVEEAVRNGEMVVVDANGDLAFSDQVREGEHGHPRSDDPAIPGKDPMHGGES